MACSSEFLSGAHYITSDGGTINFCLPSPTGLIRDTFEHRGIAELADDPRFSESRADLKSKGAIA
jgi:hypothetical protein